MKVDLSWVAVGVMVGAWGTALTASSKMQDLSIEFSRQLMEQRRDHEWKLFEIGIETGAFRPTTEPPSVASK